MRHILSTIAAATLFFCGCSTSDEWTINRNEMQFTATYPIATRATGEVFESGDAIGVYVTQYNGETATPLQVSGNYANNARTTFNGSAWKSSPTIYWEEGKFDVYAYYPYAKPSSVDEYPFTVALDQSTPKTTEALSGYEASDFLWAKAENISRMESVPLNFTHKMSKAVIKLLKGSEYSGEIPADAIVRIHNTIPVATIDLASGVVTVNGHESEKSITAKKVSEGVYTAILVPQRLESRRPLIEVLSKGVSYLIESSFVFKAGMQHTINVTLNNNPDQVKIEIGGEIENWN